jgi:hypothetical protein
VFLDHVLDANPASSSLSGGDGGSVRGWETAQDDSHQYEAKAKFLSIALGFAEWPAPAFKAANSPLQICLMQIFRLAPALRS